MSNLWNRMLFVNGDISLKEFEKKERKGENKNMEKKVSDYCLENIKDVESELSVSSLLNSAKYFENRNFPKMTLIANKIRELEALIDSSLEDLKERYQKALSDETA